MVAVFRSFSLSLVCAGVLTAVSPPARGEIELPRGNPTATLSQQVGLTDIALEYSSSAVRGRKIWGTVVPWDKPWAISPGQPVKIRFSKDVQVGDKPVTAGTYLLSAIPAKSDWTLLLRKAEETAQDKAETEPIRFRARTHAGPSRERLTFLFSDFNDERATLDLEWEKVRVSIPIVVNTSRQVLSSMADLDTTWRSYANAARYMLESKHDFDAGLKYADQSLALKPDWYTYWIKGSLLAAKGDFKGAREQGEKAATLAKGAGDGFVLEAELSRDMADWSRRSDSAK